MKRVESFAEVVNGRAREGSACMVRLNGGRYEGTYIRAVLGRPHRCRVAIWVTEDQRRVRTVSTRKVVLG